MLQVKFDYRLPLQQLGPNKLFFLFCLLFYFLILTKCAHYYPVRVWFVCLFVCLSTTFWPVQAGLIQLKKIVSLPSVQKQSRKSSKKPVFLSLRCQLNQLLVLRTNFNFIHICSCDDHYRPVQNTSVEYSVYVYVAFLFCLVSSPDVNVEPELRGSCPGYVELAVCVKAAAQVVW